MALYTIERTFPGWTADELEAAKVRAEICTLHFTDMRWLRSYVDLEAGHSTCIYEAATEEDVVAHAEMAKMPCDSVRLVEELIPDMMAVAE